MSKIGNYNLELQEVANDLGFSTVQEALDSGKYELVDGELKYIDEQTKAHEAWLIERNGLLNDLNILKDFLDGISNNHNTIELPAIFNTNQMFDVISRAIEFIEKGEV